MKKFVTLYLTFFLFICSLTAQNTIWPVQVTGALVPPHSLDLKVYGTDRMNDLNFQVFLKDPVEQSLQVKPVLTIEQNGTILYQTDMNFNGDILTLTQFEPFVLDGTILNRYLSSEALTGRAEQGRGAALVPEGFNQICLQMYGVERSVPVSNKFCVAGNFRLNQPPQIIKPAFNEKIKMPEVQNMIFSWMPMHLGSGNNPGAVDYFFELVALPQGVMNANDFFDSALKVYTTTTNATSFIYSQAEPPLQPGVYYAWRVKASSMLHPTSTLFQNEGKSEISVFVLYDGEAPTNDLNPFDNPAPRGCSVYETGYGPVSKADNEPMILAPNQDVKLGFFNMKVTEASGNSQVGYSGKGLIAFPMLRSTLEVVFTNVKVNKEGRVYDSESIEAGSGPFTLSKEQLSPENIARYVNNQYAADLYRSINDSKKVSLLTEDVSRRNELPLALVNEQNPSMMVCVTGIYFTPSHAFLNMVGLNETGEGLTFDISAATAIQATPYGLKSGSYLVPISRSSGPGSAREIIPTIEMMVSTDGSSKLFCDCSGITESKLKENLQISPDIMVRADNGGPVVLELSDKKADAKTYFGEVKGLPAFEINGMEGFRFNANKVMVDLSNTNTIENGAKFQASEEGILDPTWRGAVIQEASVSLPEAYNVFSGKGRLTLDKGEILLNENNIPYGSFSKENLISIDNGKVENWRYSVDKYSLEFLKGKFVSPSISGRLKLPVADDLINYNGELLQSGNSNASMNITMPSGDLKIGMWSANMSLSDETSIGLEIKNLGNEKMMYPSAKLSGDLNVNVSNSVLGEKLKGNIAQTLADMKQALNATSDDLSFSISGLHINNWNLSPYDLPENRYTANSVEVEKARFVLGGKSYAVTHGEILKRTIDNIEQVGVSVVIKEGNNKINVILWGAENNGSFALDQIEAQIIDIRCNCTIEPKGIGKVELQKLYDKLIHEEYWAMAPGHVPSSGKQASEPVHNKNFQIFHAEMKARLELNTTQGGWIYEDGQVYIPFLDIKIRATREGNKLVADKPGISSLEYYRDYKSKTVQNTVPILVNEELFKKLGFETNYNIPPDSRLLILDLIIPDINKSDGSLTFGLASFIREEGSKEELFSNIFDKRNLLFKSPPIKITNDTAAAIKLVDVQLVLEGSYTSEEYDYKRVVKVKGADQFSKAHIDCKKGFDRFDMRGYYKPKNLVPVGEDTLKMLFTLNTSSAGNAHDLGEFIGIIQDLNGKGEKWKFYLEGQPHIIFTAGNNFSIFLDLSSKAKISENVDCKYIKNFSNHESYKGIVFKRFASDISFIHLNNDQPLQVALKDGMYFPDTEASDGFWLVYNFSKNLTKNQDLVSETQGANFSGWKYAVDSLSFSVHASKLHEKVGFGGRMLIPIFKDKPINYEKRKFDKGWANFNGSILIENEKITAEIGFTSLKDKLFQSVLVPGMAMKLNASSKVDVRYNQQTRKWIPTGSFSGLCDFYLNDNVALSLNLISPPGLEIEADPISFENVKVSADVFNNAIKFNLDSTLVSYVSLGTWGDVDANDLAKIDEVMDFRNRLSVIGSKQNSAGISKAMPGDKGGKGGSQAMFMGFDLVSTCLGPVQRDGEIVMGLKLAIGLMGATKEKTSKGTETKAQFIRTEGVLGLSYKPSGNSQDTWKFSEVTLECLSVEGALGPVGFKGGLNILRGDSEYGSGLKGFLSGDIEGLGGMTIVGQFGKKKEGESDYYYGFLDLEVFSEQGIPLFYDPVTNVPKVDFFGAGGGIHINMNIKKPVEEVAMPDSAQMVKKDKEREDAEERKKSGNFCKKVGGELLQPGAGLNQTYTPKKGTFGGKVYAIFGPYSPKEPPYSIVADAGIAISFNWDNETNEFSLNQISLEGRGYLMPSSIRERRENNVGDIYAGITLDWPNRTLEGEIAFRSRFKVPVVNTTLFSLPIDYDKTVFNTRENYNKGRIKFSFSPSNPYAELKLGGPGTGTFKPISGTLLTSLIPLVRDSIKAYAQLGANVDAPQKLEDMIPELRGLLSKADSIERAESLKSQREPVDLGSGPAKGIAFGLTMSRGVDANFLLMHANLYLKLGFDVNLREYKDITCSNSDNQGQIGLKGWYAKGSAFAYANGRIDMGFKLFGLNLTTPVFNASAYLTMQVEGPNPTYFRGMIGGQYNVLDGMFSGDFQYKVVIGEPCEYTKPPDPLADLTIFKNASVRNGQNNVDRYSDITLNTNIPLRKDFTLTQRDVRNLPSHALIFMAEVHDVMIYTEKEFDEEAKRYRYEQQNKNNQSTPYIKNPSEIKRRLYSYKVENYGKTITISLHEALQPNTVYYIEYKFGWKEKKGYENPQYTDRDKPEWGKIKFTTGERPTRITPGMIEYSAPGDRQRYWHKGYADTEIKFHRKAEEDAKSLFPLTCTECDVLPGQTGPLKYKYVARLKEYNSNGQEISTKDFVVTGHPGQKENVEVLDSKSKTIDGRYNLTYLEKRNVNVSKVSFPDLKNYDLQKGKIYSLFIVRELDLALPDVSDANYKRYHKMIKDHFFVLKELNFGTSLYENLTEKLAKLEFAHVKSDLKMRDFSHPNDVFDSERAGVINQLGESKFHSVRDDFFSFKIKNRKGNESFDMYDIARLRRNVKLDYYHAYIPAEYVTKFHQNKGLNSILDGSVLNNPNFNLAGKSYLKQVLVDYTKAEEKGMLNFGDKTISDGSKWHYRLTGATNVSLQTLTDAEIATKTFSTQSMDLNVSAGNPQLAGKSVQGDFLIQDLRSRIVINQLYWLSKISKGTSVSYGDGYQEFISSRGKGEFMVDGRRDFSWITNPPEGTKNVYNNFIATEPGYRLSYHGHSAIYFPAGEWGEMVESKRDKGASMTGYQNLFPDRVSGSEIEIDNVTELSLEEWYYIKKDGKTRIDAKHGSGVFYPVWGLEQPYFDKNESSAYGIYTPAYGLIFDNGWTYIEDIPGDYSTLWKFSNNGSNISIRNYADKYKNVKFPAVLRSIDSHKISPKFEGDKEDDISVTFTERNQSLFNSEKVYRIKDSEGRIMKDVKNSERWRIYREGRFYRIVSNNGFILFFHRYDPIGPGDYLQVQVEKNEFPSKGTTSGSRDHYYTRLWNISDTGEGSYLIQNAFKVRHHLKIHESPVIKDEGTRVDHFFESYPEKFTIEEIR